MRRQQIHDTYLNVNINISLMKRLQILTTSRTVIKKQHNIHASQVQHNRLPGLDVLNPKPFVRHWLHVMKLQPYAFAE